MPTSLPQTRPKTLHELQAAMDEFVRSRGWYEPGCAKPQLPRNLAASIALEAGEVLECFQWSDEVDSAAVADELADVTLYVAQLANVLGLDLSVAINDKLARNHARWPAVSDEEWPRLAS